MAINEIVLGRFIIKDDVITEFVLKEDGMVYLRTSTGWEEETPVTVKQFMQGMDRMKNMLDEWRRDG